MAENGIRIVLFGLPGAGKTGLLAALAQSAQTQKQALQADLVDKSGGLTELQKNIYQGKPTEELHDQEEFPITLDQNGSGAVEAILIEGDGKEANDLVYQKSSLNGRAANDLSRNVLNADALVVAVDSVGGMTQQDFNQVARFLRQFEQYRGSRTDAVGLPVFLVLTKCDQLAKKNETLALSDWMQRIEERKRKFDKWFQEQLKQTENREDMAFGKIDLHVEATAMRRPSFADKSAKSQEPFGVAELFRQCLTSAQDYRQQVLRSSNKLKMSLAGLIVLMAWLAGLAGFFFLSRPPEELVLLENRILGLLPQRGTLSRLTMDALKQRYKDLTELKNKPLFEQLREDFKKDVSQTVEEMGAYLQFKENYIADRLNEKPFQVLAVLTRESDLRLWENRVNELKPPEKYAEEWQKYAEMRNLQAWKKEVSVLRNAVEETKSLLDAQVKEAEELRIKSPRVSDSREIKNKWFVEVDNYLIKDKELPREDKNLDKGTSLRYLTVYQIDQVKEIKRQWEEKKGTLRKLMAGLQ